MFVVTGATGNTGSIVARQLLQAGHRVRLVARHPNKLTELAALGVGPGRVDVVHNGTAPRYALITSFESGPVLEAWIDSQRASVSV